MISATGVRLVVCQLSDRLRLHNGGILSLPRCSVEPVVASIVSKCFRDARSATQQYSGAPTSPSVTCMMQSRGRWQLGGPPLYWTLVSAWMGHQCPNLNRVSGLGSIIGKQPRFYGLVFAWIIVRQSISRFIRGLALPARPPARHSELRATLQSCRLTARPCKHGMTRDRIMGTVLAGPSAESCAPLGRGESASTCPHASQRGWGSISSPTDVATGLADVSFDHAERVVSSMLSGLGWYLLNSVNCRTRFSRRRLVGKMAPDTVRDWMFAFWSWGRFWGPHLGAEPPATTSLRGQTFRYETYVAQQSCFCFSSRCPVCVCVYFYLFLVTAKRHAGLCQPRSTFRHRGVKRETMSDCETWIFMT